MTSAETAHGWSVWQRWGKSRCWTCRSTTRPLNNQPFRKCPSNPHSTIFQGTPNVSFFLVIYWGFDFFSPSEAFNVFVCQFKGKLNYMYVSMFHFIWVLSTGVQTLQTWRTHQQWLNIFESSFLSDIKFGNMHLQLVSPMCFIQMVFKWRLYEKVFLRICDFQKKKFKNCCDQIS